MAYKMLRLVKFHMGGNCRLFAFHPDKTVWWHKRYKVSEVSKLIGVGIQGLDEPRYIASYPVPGKDATLYANHHFGVFTESEISELYGKCLKAYPTLEEGDIDDIPNQKNMF